jgi:hypothetical protein
MFIATSRFRPGAGDRANAPRQARLRATYRGLVVPMIALAVLAAGASSASAATPQHMTQTFAIERDLPAGALCDFAYHEEDHGTQTITRFFDRQGNLVGAEAQIAVSILHRNTDTGLTLVEELHSTAHIDFISGQVEVTGQSWHLRAQDGRLVLAGAGLFATDLASGEILRQTPRALAADTAATICPALGGTPAG